MPRKKSVAEVEAMLRDVAIPDAELRKYLKANKTQSRPFEPGLRYDEEQVEITHADLPRTEAGVVAGFLNGVSRFRRREIFLNAVQDPATQDRKVLVTEGDSWFQFPFLLEDVVDHLTPHYNVLSVGKAGDTTENMTLKSPEFLEAIDRAAEIIARAPDGFVFSAGGNDFLGQVDGEPVFKIILREQPAGSSFDSVTSFNLPELDARIERVRRGFRSMIAAIRRDYPNLPIFLHAYDQVFPYDENDARDRRNPIYADKDQWVAGPIAKRGITDPVEQRNVTNHLLGILRGVLDDLAATNAGVHVMETGLPLQGDVGLWHDEIHPTDEGFRRVTAKFRETIDAVLM